MVEVAVAIAAQETEVACVVRSGDSTGEQRNKQPRRRRPLQSSALAAEVWERQQFEHARKNYDTKDAYDVKVGPLAQGGYRRRHSRGELRKKQTTEATAGRPSSAQNLSLQHTVAINVAIADADVACMGRVRARISELGKVEGRL